MTIKKVGVAKMMAIVLKRRRYAISRLIAMMVLMNQQGVTCFLAPTAAPGSDKSMLNVMVKVRIINLRQLLYHKLDLDKVK